MLEEPEKQGNGNRSQVSLDEASARAIARGRISRINEERKEQMRMIMRGAGHPQKRLAALRSVKGKITQVWGNSLIGIGGNKRYVVFASLEPESEAPGSLLITFCLLKWGATKDPGVIDLALISPHAVARVLERAREVDPITTISSEMFFWSIVELLSHHGKRSPFVIVPTRTGHFTGEDDQHKHLYVFTTWYADRQLNDIEQETLAKLRIEERLGLGKRVADIDLRGALKDRSHLTARPHEDARLHSHGTRRRISHNNR